jgi:hypothetical protein
MVYNNCCKHIYCKIFIKWRKPFNIKAYRPARVHELVSTYMCKNCFQLSYGVWCYFFIIIIFWLTFRKFGSYLSHCKCLNAFIDNLCTIYERQEALSNR